MTSLPLSDSGRTPTPNAYLVIREGSRWTDVYRLEPDRTVVIGRASSSQIQIPHDLCSRHHAEVFCQSGKWMVRDLNSRNGTLLDAQPVRGEQALANGQTITVAGCNMTFVRDIAQAFSGTPVIGPERASGDGDPQRTEDEHDQSLIVHRQQRAQLLTEPNHASDRAAEIARLAFRLAQCKSLQEAAALVLDATLERTGVQSGAVLAGALETQSKTIDARTQNQPLQVLAAKHPPGRSYHRLTDTLAKAVWSQGDAVLARNLQHDEALSRQDSRGLSITSTLAAPIRVNGQTNGLIHLYSSEGDQAFQPEHLDYVLTGADLLGAAWESLGRQADLVRRLDRSRRRVEQLRAQLGDQHQIIGESPAMAAVRQAVQRVAASNATVLIRGESGTGKELVAAAIHEASPRRDGPMVCLNCAALSPALLESELFGHEKGSFTGATERKIGKFEAADGGTLMLDEIGEMVLDIQAKFLRVLEGHPFERVGGNQPIRADVRVVAATNRDLEQAVRENRFRADLYYRLHVVELMLPPLRNRGNDVILIAQAIIKQLADRMGRRITGLTAAAQAKLRAHPWPGNVRELRNAIERAIVLGMGPEIDAEDLLLSDLRLESPVATASRDVPDLISLAELENLHIQRVLEATGGNKSRAATLLGIERSTLDRKLKKQ